MRLMDLLCSAHGSTSVVTSSSSTTTTPKSNHHYVPPCSSQFPIINPKPNYFFDKHRNSTSSSSSSQRKHNNNKGSELRRHSCVELSDLYHQDGSSRRYLLSDAPFIDWVSDHSNNNNNNNQIPISIVPSSSNENDDEANNSRKHHMLIHTNNNHASAPALRSSSLGSQNQVVVLRVSLHCKACEGKVRKHISKMEGVRSFSIERETKKVTIMGDVTPLGVLASVSKVKSAQLWPFPHNNNNNNNNSSSSSISIPQSPRMVHIT